MKQLFTFLIFSFLSSQLAISQSKMTAGDYRHLPANQDGLIHLLVKVDLHDAEKQFSSQNIQVGTKAGDIWTVKVNHEQLKWLQGSSSVIAIEGSKVTIPSQRLDTPSNRSMLVDKVQKAPLGYGIQSPFTGKDVIVGIVDIGFQPDHPTFYDVNGNQNRVVRYWDQLDEDGNPPQGYGYGSLHTTLSDMLAKPDLGEIHGTHVAGIAAGSGFGSENRKYAGVAYEADLVFVNIKYFDQNVPPSAKGDLLVASPAIIDGVAYIFQYADSVGKPAVVNLSWGMHTGPHDGTSLFDQAIDNLVGKGKIYVGAAGNSGWSRTHVSKTLRSDTLKTLPFNSRNVRDAVEDNYIDIWGDAHTDFQIAFGLTDTMGNELVAGNFYSTERDTVIEDLIMLSNGMGGWDSLRFHLTIVSRYAANDKPNVLVEVWNYSPARRRTSMYVVSDSTTVHAWNSGQILQWGGGGFAASFFGQSAWPGFTSGNAEYVVGENGGTGKNTISIGAYNHSENTQALDGTMHWGGTGTITGFSSRGPTVDGRTKPDMAAPGENVISAYNRNAFKPHMLNSITDTLVWKGKTEYYGTASGTSMAAPNASGVIALFLQLNDTLDVDLVKEILFASATVDDQTGSVPNNSWGHGKVNAYEGLNYIQNSVGLTVKEQNDWNLYPNPTRHRFTVSGAQPNAIYLIYDLKGSLVKQGELENNSVEFNLPTGLYAVVIQDESGNRSFRLKID